MTSSLLLRYIPQLYFMQPFNFQKDYYPLIFQEMKGQSVVFFLAGYETTSSALSLLVDVLARNPRVQEKLQEEIDEHYPDKVHRVITSTGSFPN